MHLDERGTRILRRLALARLRISEQGISHHACAWAVGWRRALASRL